MNGTISNYLLKPLSFFKHTALHELAYKIVNMITHLLVGILIVLLLKEYLHFSFSIVIIIKLIPVILIGAGIIFLSLFSIGCATFFWTESQFLSDLHWMLGLIFGGNILPLSFFPATILNLVKLNPFRYTFSFPAEIIFNKLSTNDYYFGILIGSLWVLIFAILSAWIWKSGLKKYSAFGS